MRSAALRGTRCPARPSDRDRGGDPDPEVPGSGPGLSGFGEATLPNRILWLRSRGVRRATRACRPVRSRPLDRVRRCRPDHRGNDKRSAKVGRMHLHARHRERGAVRVLAGRHGSPPRGRRPHLPPALAYRAELASGPATWRRAPGAAIHGQAGERNFEGNLRGGRGAAACRATRPLRRLRGPRRRGFVDVRMSERPTDRKCDVSDDIGLRSRQRRFPGRSVAHSISPGENG